MPTWIKLDKANVARKKKIPGYLDAKVFIWWFHECRCPIAGFFIMEDPSKKRMISRGYSVLGNP